MCAVQSCYVPFFWSCLFQIMVHFRCWAHLLLECCELQGGLGDKQMRDSYKYRVAQKKLPILFFIPKLCFTIFFPYFSGGVDSRLGRFFWHQYGSKWSYTTQQRIKIIEAYFAAKSVLLTQRQCRKDFGRNNVPTGRTIQRLVAKFQKTGSVADAHKGQDCS